MDIKNFVKAIKMAIDDFWVMNCDEFDFWEALENYTPKLPELTKEEEKALEKYEKTQQEFNEEFEANLNIEEIRIEDMEEFDPMNPKYYL